jgi:hypothetical protein
VGPGRFAHGALGYAKPAARGTVRLREDQGNGVAGGEDRFEGARREGRRAREDDAQPRRGRQAAFRWRFFSFARTRFCLSSESRSTKTLPSR